MYRAASGILEIVVSAVVVGKLLLFLQKQLQILNWVIIDGL